MIYTSSIDDIKHPEHKHKNSSHKIIRIYSREKGMENTSSFQLAGCVQIVDTS